MQKFITILSVLIIIAFVAGCGGGSSNTAASTTIYGAPTSLADPNTPTLMGGATKGGALTVKFSNYSVSTLAGTVGTIGSTNATGAAASFNHPAGITTDGTNLYVTDYLNNIIRQIDSSGVVTTLAFTDAAGTAVTFNHPTDITTDGTYLYVVDSFNHCIRQIDILAKKLTATIGSTSAVAGSVDTTVPADAKFNTPTGITTDGINLYVTDSGNHTIRMINISSKAVTTLAGAPGVPGSADGGLSADRTRSDARFNLPARVTTDRVNLYVTDYNNRTIRQVVLSSGAVTTLAGIAGTFGTVDTAPGVTATFYHPNGITTDGKYLYVTDYNDTSLPNPQYWNTIRRIDIFSTPVTVTTIAGGISSTSPNSSDGVGANARFDTPVGITTDGTNLYLADSMNNTIRKIE